MRLICPNCGAQYEVPTDVIPAEGRDVQCSACSNTWFQAHPDQDRHLADEVDDVAPEPVAPPPSQEAQASDGLQYPPNERGARHATQRRLDPGIADVLREEAEREQAARRAEQSTSLESQPELGLDEGPADDVTQRAQQAKVRMERMRGQATAPAAAPVAATTAAAGSRKDLLPDIDEINSTLRASGDRQRPTEASDADLPQTTPRTRGRGGFRVGFYGMILIAALGVAGYAYGPQVTDLVPQAEPYVAEYTSQLDTARGWLSTSVDRGLAWLDKMASENL